MYLSKLEIFGFKSFPAKTVIDFSSGVSAIVGPNGSGKSNIVDAIRWVLGEQGDKALRSEKRDDVVFSGTSKRKPLSVAEVSLTIVNNKNVLPTEYSEVQIARRFFRSGETEYYLNGTKVRLKDIRSLFMNTGIGPDAYSVIELKMIETILSHVKNERRKMFEEASGIVSYKQNRDLTFKKLESVHETLIRVNDIIREKQRNVNALERQAKKNEEAKLVYNDLKLVEIAVNGYEYSMMLSEIRDINEHEFENLSLKENLSREIDNYNIQSDAVRSEIKKLEDVAAKTNRELESLRDKINKIEREDLVTEQKVNNLSSNIIRLSEENNTLEQSITRNNEKEEETRSKVSVLARTLEISEVSLSEKKIHVDQSIKVMQEKRVEISSLGNRLREAMKLASLKKSEFDKNKIFLGYNLDRLKLLSDESQKSLTDISRLEHLRDEQENQLSGQKEKRKKAENDLLYNTQLKEDIRLKITEIEKRISEKSIELQKRNSKVSFLRNLTETFQDYAEGIGHLLKEKKTDGINTVIDSLNVEEKFRIAVETALGEISNYLIVDDSRNLTNLIDILSEDDKGKVTFILNDKLSDSSLFPYYLEIDYSEPEFFKEKGVYGSADSFVKTSKDYSLLIKYLLDEYVVVEDIDTAFRLSKDNYYKFITLDGDIVTQSFIRAGGKSKEENLKIGRESQVIHLENESAEYEKTLSSDKNILAGLLKEFDGFDISSYQAGLNSLEKDVNNITKELSILNFKIQELNKSVSGNDELYNSIQEQNKTLNDNINLLISELSKADNDQSNLEKELGFITEEFSGVESKYSDYLNDYNSFNIEITKLKSEFRSQESALARLLSSIEYQTGQIEKNRKQIDADTGIAEELRRTLAENSDVIAGLSASKDSITTSFRDVEKDLNSKKESEEEIEYNQRTKRSILDKVSQKLIDSQVKIKENEIKSDLLKDILLKKYEFDIDNPPDVLSAEVEEISSRYKDGDGEFQISGARKDAEELSEMLKKLGGGFQQIIWDDFQNEKDELQKMIDQKNDLAESEKDIRKTIDRINTEARERFLHTFEEIRQNFIRIFKELFQEGDEANLKLVYDEDEDGKISDDPLEAKIEITAKPRGKRPTSIELLSGGEKTLTAIALLFAIYLVKPSPFCILDEVDAPLDVANLGRFNRMIRKFSEKTQFILITHNERTMESVDTLYGVTMQEPGVTTIVETRFK